MKFLSKLILLAVITASISACQTTPLEHRLLKAGFKTELVQGGDFLITTAQKITDQSKPYVFYIEGDGMAFISKYRISLDPTPKHRMTLDLAAIDQRPNVIYISRPCQYTPMEMNPKCSYPYWTTKRMSEEVVDSVNQAINKLNNGQKFSLVGFSGGGGIAVLIAARNPKVKDVITVAGNIDHETFTDFHKVTPMTESLNPVAYAKKLNKLPQLHLSGGKDKIVPSIVAENYTKTANSRCVKQRTYPDNEHQKGWEKVWPEISDEPVNCD